MTRAAARAPRKDPVRLTSMTCRQVAASVSRGPATMGEIPALQIQASTPPHSDTVASATASLKSSSVTSPLRTREAPGSACATALRSRSVRATSATDAPARETAGDRGARAARSRDGKARGFVHLSTGQEAAPVGAFWPLGPADVITSTHRGHGHCLAKGLDPLGMFAELMGKEQGTNRGRGGSMHIADPGIGIFGANGIVAAGVPIAAGAATAAQLRADGSVTVAFFGDGAVAQGAFHEALNLAAVWKLPVVFFCENNGYAEFSPASTQHAASLELRAAGYGIPYVAVDGNDAVAVATVMEDVVGAARDGSGPSVVEAATYRWHGHYEGDRSEERRV